MITVIPFTAETGKVAEKLCDYIYLLSGKQSIGDCLLVPAHNVHEELLMLVSTSAENAFQNVEVTQAPEYPGTNPMEQNNLLFRFAAEYMQKHYKVPWFWLEPHCVPLKPNWREQLSEAYDKQPKRFMGGHLQISPKTPDREAVICLSRVAVYPPDAIVDILPFCNQPAHFNLIGAQYITPRSTKSRLVQELQFNGDEKAIRSDAVILNCDTTGNLIDKRMSEIPLTPTPESETKTKMTASERMAHARKFRKTNETQMARL